MKLVCKTVYCVTALPCIEERLSKLCSAGDIATHCCVWKRCTKGLH